MKLVIAIVHDEDAHDLVEELTEKEYGVTKLASTGGFLKAGNTTLLIGVPKRQVDDVIEVIKDTCDTRKEYTTTNTMVGNATGFVGMPIEVTVGGATIFVIDVENYLKI